MNDFLKNTMAMIIIGDESNEKFDGKIKLNGKKEGYFFHRDSIRQIVSEIRREGYSLGKVNSSIITEAGYDLVNMGHLLFCNCTIEDNYFGYIFLPNKLTNKQVESLKQFEETFQKFESLYLMKIDENDKEHFETKENSHYFNVDELANENLHSKTR